MWGRRDSKTLKGKNILATRIISGINISLILLALNTFSVNLGLFQQSLMLVFTTSLFIGILLLNLPLKKTCQMIIRKDPNIDKILFGLILILSSFALLLYTKTSILYVASVPVLLLGLDLILNAVKRERKELYFLSAASFIYAIFFIFLQTIPVLWYILRQFSLLFSSIIGSLIGKHLLLGPSASGLWIVVVFMIFIIVSFIVSSKKQQQIFKLISSLFGLLISWIIYLIILGFVEFESKNDTMGLHALLFLFCLLPTLFYLLSYEFKRSTKNILTIKDIKTKKIIKNTTIYALILFFISSITLTTFFYTDTTSLEDTKILFYAQNMLGTWDIPEYGTYGREASGMFGLLPIYLSMSGFENELIVENRTTFFNITSQSFENITIPRYLNLTDHVSIIESPRINEEILSDVDVFVVVNTNKTFLADEKKAIWDFVEKGGSLLVLGDHTDVGGIQEPLNDLLQPVDIRFRFDSALPLDTTFQWATCYQLPHHPITSNIQNLDELQISVGASLDITSSSSPIIIGRYALSDVGDHLNEEFAYLGDYEYGPGEQLGDIILAAASYYGDGKVVVFGDTSSFQNSALTYSYPFIQNIFTWLQNKTTSSMELLQTIVSIILLSAAFLLFIVTKNKRVPFLFFPIALCIALLLSATINPLLTAEIEITGDIIYIDASHTERFTQEPFTDDSLSGLILNLNRNGYLPILLRDFSKEKIKESEILFFNAPTKSFTGDEVDFLKQYMSKGGFIVLATGYEDRYASLPLLDEFDISVENIPLGPVPYVEENPEEYENETRFVDSWPIIFNKDTSRSFYSFNFTWDTGEVTIYHLMVFVEHGKGGVLFISDSGYLLDKNVESIYDYWPGNILMLKHIFDEFKDYGGEK